MTIVGRQNLLDGTASLGLQARDGLDTVGFHITRRDDSFYQVTDRLGRPPALGLVDLQLRSL
jgi:hypothetical protein